MDLAAALLDSWDRQIALLTAVTDLIDEGNRLSSSPIFLGLIRL